MSSPSDARDSLAVIPWYWRDWRASSARAVLSRKPIAGWCYRELLDAMWGSDTCDLPSDDAELAALAGVTDAQWAGVKDAVLRFLPLDPATGRRTHPRSKHEHAKALAYRDRCRAGGRATAEKRWGTDRVATDTLPATLQPSNRTPSPSPSPSPTPTAAASGRAAEDPHPQETGPGAVPTTATPDPLAARLAAKIGWASAPFVAKILDELRAEGDADAWLESRVDATPTARLSPIEWAKATRRARGAARATDDERIAAQRSAESWATRALDAERAGEDERASGAWAQVEASARILGKTSAHFGASKRAEQPS